MARRHHGLRHGRQGHVRGVAEVAEAPGRARRLRDGLRAVPPIDALQMAIQGSVYFTWPAPPTISRPAERAELSNALFDHVANGRIKIEINQRYELDEAVQAHRDLEAGRRRARRSS